MDEQLFARLVDWLDQEPVVLASVISTRGATPRKRGTRMLVAASRTAFSVGGGLAETRVADAARRLLESDTQSSMLEIDLGGGLDAAGICGGRMQLALRRWHGGQDRLRVQQIASQLASGMQVELTSADVGADVRDEVAGPEPRLLIVGAGHCGEALYRLARDVGFDVRIHDTRRECFSDAGYAAEHVICGDISRVSEALDTARVLYVVLLNRDFQSDIAALDLLCRRPPDFLGMMGSRRRIATVRDALPQHAEALEKLFAPVGLDIGAETPEEIAISILAQLIEVRRRQDQGGG